MLEKRRVMLGMDQDTDERDIQNGFARKNINVRVGSSDTSNKNSVEAAKGNTVILSSLPSGNNKAIGAYEYKQKNKVYYFIWNSNNDHSIYEYDHTFDTVELVITTSILNFQEWSVITGINVVELDSNNDLLYWVDRANPPRKINIQKAKNGDYTVVDESVIDAIKYPPLRQPDAQYNSNSDRNSNLMRNELWQFRARYVYDDYEKSAWSPISKQTIPLNTDLNSITSIDNEIIVTIPQGGTLVRRVEIAAREDNVSDFKLIADKKTTDYSIDTNGNYVYVFANDGIYNNIDILQANQLYDNVPIIAGAQEYIEDNRIVYGDVIEGYDGVDTDVDISIDYESKGDLEGLDKPTNTINGTLRIYGVFNEGFKNYGQEGQPIRTLHADNETIVFGGFSRTNSQQRNKDGSGLMGAQKIPLGGFIVYLAGTDYYARTTQDIRFPGNAGTQNPDSGIVLVRNSTFRSIKKVMEDGGFTSRFSITDVPDGTYSLRVASHRTTREDLLSDDRRYQKTSTFVMYNGDSRNEFFYEQIVSVSGGEIKSVGEIGIADTQNSSVDAGVLEGNFIDLREDTAPSATEDLKALTKVPYSLIKFNADSSQLADGFYVNNRRSMLNTIRRNRAYTDHNGYYWFPFRKDLSGLSSPTTTDSAVTISGYTPTLNFYDATDPVATPIPFPSVSGNLEVLIVNTDTGLSVNRSILVEGTMTDTNGRNLPNVSLVPYYSETYTSDGEGFYSIPIYSLTPTFMNVGSVEYEGNILSYNRRFDVSYSFSSTLNLNYLDTIFYPSDNIELNIQAEALFTSGISVFKRGSTQKLGLVYYDRANRSGTVQEAFDLEIPFYTQKVRQGLQSDPTLDGFRYGDYPVVAGYIYHTPPQWATHYQWVKTKNTFTNDYIQFVTKEVTYKNRAGSSSSRNDASLIEIDISNIVGEYKDQNPSSKLVYDFVEGDRVRFIRKANRDYFDSYVDLEVLSFDAANQILTVENNFSLEPLSTTGGDTIEIYTPKLRDQEDIYYEFGEMYEIGNPGQSDRFHKGGDTSQNPNLGTPAITTFSSGDTYLIPRSMPITSSTSFNDIMESASFSDYTSKEVSDIGRPNLVDDNFRQIRRPSTINYSEQFVPETQINGLNTFYLDAFKSYDRDYGSIQKLYSHGEKLDVYQELRVGSVLINRNILFDTFQQGTVGSSDSVLSPISYYGGEFGIGFNPESFAEYGGRRYFVDLRRGAVLRLSNNGLTPISDALMEEYFLDKFSRYLAFEQVPTVWGVYDKDFDEYVVSMGETTRALVPAESVTGVNFGDPEITDRRIANSTLYEFTIQEIENNMGVQVNSDIYRDITQGRYIIVFTGEQPVLSRQSEDSIPAETLAYSEKTKYWTSFYSFIPEAMCPAGVTFVSFKNGNIFLHNTNDTRGNYYGVTYDCETWIPFNQDSSKVKVFQAISIEGNSLWLPYSLVTRRGQETNLIEEDFQEDQGNSLVFDNREGIYYSAIYKDVNTPNVTNAVFEGDDMRDTSILVKFRSTVTTEALMYAANINYNNSERSNK